MTLFAAQRKDRRAPCQALARASSLTRRRTLRALSLLLLPALPLGMTACGTSGKERAPRAAVGGMALGGHIGPAVATTPVLRDDEGERAGPARFVQPLLGIFERSSAMAIAQDLDSHYRSPASEGYERGIDRVNAELYGAGFGVGDQYKLRVISQPMAAPAWTPISAEIAVVGSGNGTRRTKVSIAGFKKPGDEQRLLIAEGGPSATVVGPAVFEMDHVAQGSILVTDRSVRSVEKEAVEKGAAAIVSWYQLPYCLDPTGDGREIEAIFHGAVRPGASIPSFYVSPRIADVMRVASDTGALFELDAKVRTETRNLRTTVATIVGTEATGASSDKAVYVVTAVSGAGANDNAAGVGGIIEAALSLKRLIASGQIARPRHSVHFVFGKEAEAGGTAMDAMGDTPIAGIVADMIGASYQRTGAICLLERGWDPGAIVALPPDTHTPWGAGNVVEEEIIPNGLALIVRHALVDVGTAIQAETDSSWSTREHPWEGGSDHDTFLGRGIPAVLVWHFTDFAYSTSLDRLRHVNGEELRRTAVAIVAGAMAVADAAPVDMPRYAMSLETERTLRLQSARAADQTVGLGDAWNEWFGGADLWLRALTQGQEIPALNGLRDLESYNDAR